MPAIADRPARGVTIHRGDLGGTASYKTRSYVFVRNADPTLCLGRVRIRADRDVDEYLLDEELDEVPAVPGWRFFLLARQSGEITPACGGVYRVTLKPHNQCECSCIGDATRHRVGVCKHAALIRDLAARGRLPRRRHP